ALPATVLRVQDSRTHTIITAMVGETPVKVRLHPELALPQAGEGIWLQVMGAHTCFYANEELVA
ncbi:MAG: ABC transporter ATP-binding protein, partial [Serpentinimonas sp.]|nr:ABC transporter ATP-binding protein [Serpentinimonas sp.]